jgi:hypothetical protein
MEVDRLKAKVSNRYEIEARTLEHMIVRQGNAGAYEEQLKAGREALENFREALTPSPEVVAREKRLAEFEEKLHQTAMAVLESVRTRNTDKTGHGVKGKPANEATAIGRNIDRLRKECGWSLDQLVKESGIDKKLILSHVNKGARPTPRILKEYAQTFSKALGRTITAPDLEK